MNIVSSSIIVFLIIMCVCVCTAFMHFICVKEDAPLLPMLCIHLRSSSIRDHPLFEVAFSNKYDTIAQCLIVH